MTQLPSGLSLGTEWRVGLCEIHYTNSWFNLNGFNDVGIVEVSRPNVRHSYYAAIEPGRYNDINQLLSLIRQSIKTDSEITVSPKIDCNTFSRRVVMTHGKTKDNKLLMYRFGAELSDLLGISSGFVSKTSALMDNMPDDIRNNVSNAILPAANKTDEVLESKTSFDLSGGINSLYVYSDLVDYTTVGDVKAQLLRVVKIPSDAKFGDAVNITFERPYYIPLSKRDVRSIEIEIKDDAGSLVNFAFGRVEVTLHFTSDQQQHG